MDDYLKSILDQFEYYKQLGENTFNQIPAEKLFWKLNKESNSIAIIVKHLHGNMLSRWTNFLTSDGEKDLRKRDQEFVDDIKSKTELLNKWNEGWDCLFKAIKNLNDNDLTKIVYIRNKEHSVTEAIHRQLAHYSFHVGQIVYLGKIICGNNWNSLSIPKGKSDDFNSEQFSKNKP